MRHALRQVGRHYFQTRGDVQGLPAVIGKLPYRTGVDVLGPAAAKRGAGRGEKGAKEVRSNGFPMRHRIAYVPHEAKEVLDPLRNLAVAA
jgi:hypothetical protein